MTMKRIDPASERGRRALAEMRAQFGLDLAEVLPRDMWEIIEVGGRAEVGVNRDGVRALALLAGRPDVGERVIRGAEQIVRGPGDEH